MGPFQQPDSNVHAHGMSSAEERRWRNDDVNPEDLQDPFDVARQAREIQRRDRDSRGFADLEVGYISLVGVEMFDV